MSYAARKRAEKIVISLSREYGLDPWNWHTRQNPFQVLIGTVLSQRTADPKTDLAARSLFSRFPTPKKLASAPLKEIQKLVRPANYYRTKAHRVREISRMIVERFSGRVPDSMEELLSLPGVGLKTASCVMVYGFGKPAMPVDTHVHRISNRMGLIRTRTPEESERELWKVIPSRYVMQYNELLVKHGQSTCSPIRPLSYRCAVAKLCDYQPKTPEPGRRV